MLTIFVDNASANKVELDFVRKKMSVWKNSPILGGKYLHVRCLAHILYLIVRAVLKTMEKSVSAIRNAVRYAKSSSSRLATFRQCVLDVPTRSNSTFIMLDITIELKTFSDMMAEDEDTKYVSYFDEDETLRENKDDEVTEVDQTGIKKRVWPPVEDD